MLSVIFNLSRYIPALLRVKLFASRVSMLIIDNIFVLSLLFLVGRADTPYTGLLVLILISATYWYSINGMLLVVAGQFAGLMVLTMTHPFTPIILDPLRAGLGSVLILLLIGLLTERLTHVERQERDDFERLSVKNRIESDRLLALLNSLDDAMLVIDAKGHIVLANAAVNSLAGLAEQGSLAGQDVSNVLPFRHRVKGPVTFQAIVKGNSGPQRHRDLVIVNTDGSTVELDISITPVSFEDLGDTNYILAARDITKQKSLDQQREEFISVASHELRTPISIIEAALSTALLTKSSLSADNAMLVEQAYRNTLFLANLIKDFTTLSQAQNDNIQVRLEPVDPGVMVAQLVRDFTPLAESAGLVIKNNVGAGTPTVLSTEHHIREILENYMRNALKYTKQGIIIIKAEPSHGGGVLYSVEDSGIGISASDQKHLFEKFYRSEDFRIRETGGSGLGLYLCLELANRLNGKVWCTSKLNKGSKFYLEVPPFSKLDRDHGKVVQAEVSTIIEQL